MTTPGGITGYPDFMRAPQRLSANLFPSDNQNLPAGSTYTGYIGMTQWASLLVRIVPTAGYLTVTAAWYETAAATYPSGSDSWDVNTDTALSVLIPVKGKFCRIQLDNLTTTARNVTTTAYGTASSVAAITYPVTAQVVHGSNTALAAGGTDTYHPAWVCRGPGTLWFYPEDGSGALEAQLSVVDGAGTVQYVLWDSPGPTSAVAERLSVPDTLWQLVVNNNGTTAHGYKTAITVPGAG